MRNFRKYVILSVAMILAVLALSMRGVNAQSGFLLSANNTGSNSTSNTANTTNTANTSNTANTANTANTSTTKLTTSNNINANKDVPATTNTTETTSLPKTGENDVYVISAIGALALVIGGVAYARSRKLDM